MSRARPLGGPRAARVPSAWRGRAASVRCAARLPGGAALRASAARPHAARVRPGARGGLGAL